MKHAKNIKAGELKVGDKFFVTRTHYQAPNTEEVVTVEHIRSTKSGRLDFTISGRKWTNGPISPNTYMQD